MLFTILTFLTGLAGPAATLIGKLSDNKAALALASTEKERQEILAAMEELQNRKTLLVAEAGDCIGLVTNLLVRASFALIVWCLIAKLILWDKVVGSFLGHSVDGSMFTTDPLDAYQWSLVMTVFAYYFLALWKRGS